MIISTSYCQEMDAPAIVDLWDVVAAYIDSDTILEHGECIFF